MDNKEEVDDGGVPDEQQQHVESKEESNSEFNNNVKEDMEVDNDREKSVEVAANRVGEESHVEEEEEGENTNTPHPSIDDAAQGRRLCSKPVTSLSSSSSYQVQPEEDDDDEKCQEEEEEEEEEINKDGTLPSAAEAELNKIDDDGDSTPRKEQDMAEMETVAQPPPPADTFKTSSSSKSFLLDASGGGGDVAAGDESGTEDERNAFMKELETFHKENCLDFKPPKFYQEPLNCLKLWRAVIRLGGYEQVTSLKLWRQVGESFRPPKTCTTVSWTFRGFYEKALLEYEKYKIRVGELPFTGASTLPDPASGNQVDLIHASGSGRARRDAAARAMQGWHSQRLLGNGEVGDPIIKDKNPIMTQKREKQLRNIGFLKRKGSSPVEHAVKVTRVSSKSQLEVMVVDVGDPADWVKVSVQRMNDCYEVYALVPGLLREEVHVQSDPAGRLVISGQPEQQDNPWGVAPFKKVVSLPTRIDPHQTSAVVTLHGQLFVRVPYEQADM